MGDMAIGMVGLGVMGRNLALNIEEKGFSVAAYDAWPEPVERFAAATQGKAIGAFTSIEGFVRALRRPRRIIMLVKAGEVVDKTIAALRPYLEPGDILVDAGNEHFVITERRTRELESAGIRYFGMGVSGGEMGARHGPSMMPGGDREAYEELAPILTKVAAQHQDGPCVTYVGPGGAGHYVKMVHNGIEYGDMQLIAEAYDVLKTLGGLTNAELADVFAEWNRGELESFLIEITAKIFRVNDPEGPAESRTTLTGPANEESRTTLTGPTDGSAGAGPRPASTSGDLVDAILDAASMKGTGKWTVQEAAGVAAIPTIATSVEARVLSSAPEERQRAAKLLPGPLPAAGGLPRGELCAAVRAALYASKACSYAQGMNLLRAASDAYGWDLRLGELARIWQDGCIIRARFLSRIKAAYDRNPALPNLLFDPAFREELAARQDGWRKVVAASATAGLPVLSMGASLAYYDSIRRERLPANLTQAQRDFFGAHTYKRLDREGDFHTDWSSLT